MASAKQNSLKSESISRFRIVLFSLIALKIDNPLIYILLFLWAVFTEWGKLWMLLLVMTLVLAAETWRYDFLSVGIIEDINNDRYTVNKLFYKTYLDTGNRLSIGDIVITSDSHKNEGNSLKYNVLFLSDNYRYLATFRLKRYFHDKLQEHPPEVRDLIDQTLNHRHPEADLSYDLGYGLIGYYFFRRLSKKYPFLSFFAIVIFNLIFLSQAKYLLIICDLFSHHFKVGSYDRFTIKILTIAIINRALFDSYAILIPLLFEFYQLIDLDLSFTHYLCLIESFLFCRIDLLSALLFRYLVLIRSGLFVSALACLLFPFLERLLLTYAGLYSFFNTIHFDIRGTLSILTILFYFLIVNVFHIRKQWIKTVITILLIASPFNDPFFHITFIDVGQGDASLIRYPLSKQAVLIDTGSAYNYQKLQKRLFSEGLYEISYLIVTHDDADHNGNISNLQNDFKIRNIINQGQDLQYRDLVFHYLPVDEFDNDNDNSLVYLLKINGYSILFTGDISSVVEKQLIRQYGDLDIDILKVSHHGSKSASSDYFISHIRPEFAFISTSGMYYHPHYRVLNTLKRYGCRYFITRDQGSIGLYFTRAGDFIKTDKNEFVIIR